MTREVSHPLISGLLFYGQSLGLDIEGILQPLGPSFGDFRDVDGKTSEANYDFILHQLAIESGDPHFGLNYGKQFHLNHIGVLGHLMMNCETLGKAIEVYQKFQRAFKRWSGRASFERVWNQG